MPPWVYILFYFLIFSSSYWVFCGALWAKCLRRRLWVCLSELRLPFWRCGFQLPSRKKKILLRPQNLLLICIYTSEWIADCRWPGSWVWHLRELELVSPTLFYVSAAACAAKSIFVSRSRRAVLAALYTEQKIAVKQWAIYQLNFVQHKFNYVF